MVHSSRRQVIIGHMRRGEACVRLYKSNLIKWNYENDNCTGFEAMAKSTLTYFLRRDDSNLKQNDRWKTTSIT